MTRRPVFTSEITSGGTIGQQLRVSKFAQEGYKQFAYEKMRAEFALGLLEAIERCRYPAVVQVSENEGDDAEDGWISIEIRANLTLVRYVDVQIPRAVFIPEPEPLKLDTGWKKRLRFLFSGSLDDLK